MDYAAILAFGHANHHIAQADIVLVAGHASSDADEKSPLGGRESAGYVRGDGRRSALSLVAGEARKDDVLAAKLAEDVYIRVALPRGQAGMFVIQHIADGAHLEADSADDRDGVIFVPPRGAGRVRHCGVS